MIAIYRQFESTGDAPHVLTRSGAWIQHANRNHNLFIGTVLTYDNEADAAPLLATKQPAAYLDAFSYEFGSPES